MSFESNLKEAGRLEKRAEGFILRMYNTLKDLREAIEKKDEDRARKLFRWESRFERREWITYEDLINKLNQLTIGLPEQVQKRINEIKEKLEINEKKLADELSRRTGKVRQHLEAEDWEALDAEMEEIKETLSSTETLLHNELYEELESIHSRRKERAKKYASTFLKVMPKRIKLLRKTAKRKREIDDILLNRDGRINVEELKELVGANAEFHPGKEFQSLRYYVWKLKKSSEFFNQRYNYTKSLILPTNKSRLEKVYGEIDTPNKKIYTLLYSNLQEIYSISIQSLQALIDLERLYAQEASILLKVKDNKDHDLYTKYIDLVRIERIAYSHISEHKCRMIIKKIIDLIRYYKRYNKDIEFLTPGTPYFHIGLGIAISAVWSVLCVIPAFCLSNPNFTGIIPPFRYIITGLAPLIVFGGGPEIAKLKESFGEFKRLSI